MTSQLNAQKTPEQIAGSAGCRRPASFPKDYCHKLKSGIARLETAIRLQYEETFPASSRRIAQALEEAKEAAWNTPFPSLFFPALAHLRVKQMMPSA